MTQAGAIRSRIIEQWLEPARRRGEERLTVRAGDAHKAMGLSNSYPAVCSVLGSNKFAAGARVLPIARDGPANGANAYFTFDLRPTASLASWRVRRTEPAVVKGDKRKQPHASAALDWKHSLVLISCVKSKLRRKAAAADLYISAQFKMSRALAIAQGADFMILSARYGLVEPKRQIEPYDYTLNRLGVHERREWAAAVLKDLLPLAKRKRRIVLLAGARYREFLIAPLRRNGVVVEVPMEGLRQGEQLSWLKSHL